MTKFEQRKMILSLLFIIHIFITTTSYRPQYDYFCLGEYQLCDTGDCTLSDNFCGRCDPHQYLCPDGRTCFDQVEDYVNCPGVKGTHLDWTLDLEKRLEYLVQAATLDEKYRQLTHDAPGIDRLAIPPYNWLNDNQHGVRNAYATAFPDGCGLGASWSQELILDVANTIAVESRAIHNDLVTVGIRGTGMNWGGGGATISLYAPHLNLVRDPRWGRAQEVFSEDPLLTAKLTKSFVIGLQEGKQGNNKYLLTAACCKHFAAYSLESQPELRYTFNSNVDFRNWAETYSPAFYSCIVEAKGAHVMCAYNAVNGIPACANSDLLTKVLRNQWNFTGFVVSDYDSMAQIYETHRYAFDYAEAVSLALKAGCDQEGGGTAAIDQIPAAIQRKWIDIEDVNRAFRRLFRIRLQLGLFDPPTHVPYNHFQHILYNTEEGISLSRKAAELSICLYKNKNNVLPLDKNKINKLVVVGAHAIDTITLLGNYATYPDEGATTILHGLRDLLDEEHITECTFRENYDYYQPGQVGIMSYNAEECCHLCMEDDECRYFTYIHSQCYLKTNIEGRRFEWGRVSGTVMNKPIGGFKTKVVYRKGCLTAACPNTDEFHKVLSILPDADAVIITLGLDQSLENEGNDRTHIELPGHQSTLVSLIRKTTNVPIICILIHGGALALQNAAEDCDAILDAWYPGAQGGHAVANAIFGIINPAGRTPVTFYKSTDDLPTPGQMNWYAGKGISYRYFHGEPLFPFGFGLSYTEFSYSNLKSNVTGKHQTLSNPCDIVELSISVTNIGDRDGDEVVQVYISQPDASVAVPQIRLADFKRVFIKAKETLEVKLIITPRYRSVVYESVTWYEPQIMIEQGNINVYVGGGQPKYFPGHLSALFYISQTVPFSFCPQHN